MAKISNTTAYPNITPTASDYLVLTDTSTSANLTKTVTVQALADFIDDQVTLQEVLDTGSNATWTAGKWQGIINLSKPGIPASVITLDVNGTSGNTNVASVYTNGNLEVGGDTKSQTLTVPGLSQLTTVNIDGGTIDNTRIGTSLASDAKFTSVSGSAAITTSGVRNANPANAAAALRVFVGPVQFGNTSGAGFGDVGNIMISNGSDGTPEWIDQAQLEPNQVLKDVRNQTGGPLVKGTAVHLDPNPSGNPLVVAADYRNNSSMPASGLVYEDIATGQNGKIILVGLLEAVSVSISGTPAVGDVVYVSTGGTLTVDRPVAFDEQVQNVGIISRTAGQTDIQVTCTGRINDLPNLRATGIFVGSNAPGEVGKAVDTDIITVDNNNPVLPDYDVTIGNSAGSTALVRGKYRIDATHPYGEDNVGLGSLALDSTSLTGTNNVGIGVSALESLTLGSNNIAVGKDSLDALLLGSSNVAIGSSALTSSTQGSDNIAIGVNAAGNSVDSIRNVAIGTEALRNVTGNTNNQNIAIGWRAADALTTGENTIVIGAQALGNQVTSTTRSTIVGASAAGNINIATANDATLVGFEAGWNTSASPITAVGTQAGRQSGIKGTYVGYQAGLNSTGAGSTFIGSQAGLQNTTGTDNTLLGVFAGGVMNTGSNNTLLGSGAGDLLINGSDNVVIGMDANVQNGTDAESVIIGKQAIGPGQATVIGNGANANQAGQVVIGSGATSAGVAAPYIAFSDAVGSSYFNNAVASLQAPDNAGAAAKGIPIGGIYVVGPAAGPPSDPATLAIRTQ